jgi:hypothetical protein
MTTSKSSKNAISHGAYSSEAVLLWENVQEFKDLRKSFQEELLPDGAAEEAAVFDLTCLHWKKRRLNIVSQLAFRRAPDMSALAKAGRDGWEGIADYLANSVQGAETTRESLRNVAKAYCEASATFSKGLQKQLQRALSHDVVPCETPAPGGMPALDATPSPDATPASSGTRNAMPPPDATNQASELSNDQWERLILLAKEMNIYSRAIAPLLSMIRNYDADEKLCERAYRPELMERELKICADIDKRIEKTLTRLAWLKDYKKLYGPKEVKALPAGATALPANSQAPELCGSQGLPNTIPSNDEAEPTTLSAT